MRRHLVAGAAGFLGSHLVDALLQEGDEVLGVDNLSTGTARNLDAAKQNPRFRFRRHDVTRPLTPSGGIDRIWNLASPASPPDYIAAPIDTMRAGAFGSFHLLELARKKDARYLFASTSEVYGDAEVNPQPEEYWGHVNPIGERSMYDESKRFAEALTMAYHRTHGADTRIVRIFNTYGPRMRLDDGRAVPNFLAQALSGRPLTIYGDGRQTRSFCYVDDEIDGIRRLMESRHHEPINIGNPEEHTILELAEAVERAVGRRLRRVRKPLPEDDPRQRRPDITKARRLLGWRPRVALKEGLRRTLEWFQAQPRR